ncbi:bifunctional antitoxin/transcriptional repressor RelB [Salmonella enterica subsp. enterica]|nr:bifunctional antitoxin/transcriptional repressor RelB [Salmonella enterica subsp. enterica]
MATLNVRLDDKLKNEAYAVLEKLNITPTEAVRLLFQYVAETGRMPSENRHS